MAMNQKYNSLIENGTWELISHLNRAKIIIEKQYFKLKKDWFRHIFKYKTRWVAHSYKQEEKLDYIEIFAAVVNPMIYKCLFILEIKRGYWIRHIDIVIVFLYSFLEKVIYIKQSNLFVTDFENICNLNMASCRLKQVLYVGTRLLSNFLISRDLLNLNQTVGFLYQQIRNFS